jgi:hypothetical protein
MKPKLGQHLFYTAPDDAGIKPGPYPCVVTSECGTVITAFGAGRAAAQVFDVDPSQLSADGNPYKAPAPSPVAPAPSPVVTSAQLPGVAPRVRKTAKVKK